MHARIAETTHAYLKIRLIEEFEKAQIQKTELAQRLGVHEKQVRRLLDRQASTSLASFDEAFKALGLSLSVEILKLRRASN
jgi:antitoxin HicB